MSDDLISRLRALARHEHDDVSVGDEAAAEIEQLRESVAALGEAKRAGMRVWASFCLEHPEAADWFDEDGVPL